MQDSLSRVPSSAKTTIQDHPVSNMPVHFVHPCRTHEAMRDVCASQVLQPIVYLLKWFDVFAGVVGLTIPHDVAQEVDNLERI